MLFITAQKGFRRLPSTIRCWQRAANSGTFFRGCPHTLSAAPVCVPHTRSPALSRRNPAAVKHRAAAGRAGGGQTAGPRHRPHPRRPAHQDGGGERGSGSGTTPAAAGARRRAGGSATSAAVMVRVARDCCVCGRGERGASEGGARGGRSAVRGGGGGLGKSTG